MQSICCIPSDDMLGFRNTFTLVVLVLLFGSVLLALGSIGPGPEPWRLAAVSECGVRLERLRGFSLLLRAVGFQAPSAKPKHATSVARGTSEEELMIVTLGPIPKAERVTRLQLACSRGLQSGRPRPRCLQPCGVSALGRMQSSQHASLNATKTCFVEV